MAGRRIRCSPARFTPSTRQLWHSETPDGSLSSVGCLPVQSNPVLPSLLVPRIIASELLSPRFDSDDLRIPTSEFGPRLLRSRLSQGKNLMLCSGFGNYRLEDAEYPKADLGDRDIPTF